MWDRKETTRIVASARRCYQHQGWWDREKMVLQDLTSQAELDRLQSQMEAELEWLLYVGRGCLAGFGLKDETQLLPRTQPEVDRQGLKNFGLSMIPQPLSSASASHQPNPARSWRGRESGKGSAWDTKVTKQVKRRGGMEMSINKQRTSSGRQEDYFQTCIYYGVTQHNATSFRSRSFDTVSSSFSLTLPGKIIHHLLWDCPVSFTAIYPGYLLPHSLQTKNSFLNTLCGLIHAIFLCIECPPPLFLPIGLLCILQSPSQLLPLGKNYPTHPVLHCRTSLSLCSAFLKY